MSHETLFDSMGGSLAASSPLWFHYIEGFAGVYLALAGAALVTIRICIAIRKWRNNT